MNHLRLNGAYPVARLGLSAEDLQMVLRVYFQDPARVESDDFEHMSDVFAKLHEAEWLVLHAWTMGVLDATRALPRA
jgi:hypothetical protein